MKGLLNVDGKFGRLIVKFNQALLLSIYFILFSLPVFTWGASACALYSTARKMLNDEEGGLFSNYWDAFKSSFKQGVVVGCATLVFLAVVIYCTLLMIKLNMFAGTVGKALAVVYYLIVIAALAWVHIILSYIARFNDSLKTVLYNTIYLALLHYHVTFRMGVQLVIVVASIYFVDLFPYLPIVMMILPSGYSMMTIRPMEKMFSKYMPKEEAESPETAGEEADA